MANLNADISFSDAAMARLYQSVALPFLFVPINAVAYIGLAQRSTAQASSLLNVFRNLGGTFGIAISQTLLSNHMQVRQAELTYPLNPLDPAYRDWMQTAQGALAGAGGDPQTTSLAVLMHEAQKQAVMLSFIDVYYALTLLVLAVTPLVLLMRSGKNGGVKPGVGH
jgi:DHA2 family multidrug resistance protein